MTNAVAYYRVSTKQQGFSGLGLSAQKSSVHSHAQTNKFAIIREYKEVESGKKNKRPKLHQALEECKRTGATLLIARLDRLSRNLFFICSLIEANVDFIAVDFPTANKFVLHIFAAVAEYESDLASKRTKESLGAAKAKGVVLGKFAKKVLSKRNAKRAKKFARKMKPIIVMLNKEGYKSCRKIAEQLNKRRIKTYAGKKSKWHSTTVHKLLQRINQNSK